MGDKVVTTLLFEEAKLIIPTAYKELNKEAEAMKTRLVQIEQNIERYGYYEHTEAELIYGAKMHGEIITALLDACFGKICMSSIKGR